MSAPAAYRLWISLLLASATFYLFCHLHLVASTSLDSTAETSPSHERDAQEIETYKAIRSLHAKLDHDADGEVDDLESKRFLESDSGAGTARAYSTAQKIKYLHQDGKDRSISVNELWDAWKMSSTHNWTVDETVYWLSNHVELPEYASLFEKNSVNGSMLPRLAADTYFVSRIGITDPSAKSKISIKAMDVVLFGPPKLSSTRNRDIVLSIIILIAISSCGLFYSRSLASQRELKSIQDSKLQSLQKAEDQMLELQQELEKALKAQEAVATEKKNLEHQLKMQRQSSATGISNGQKGADDIESKQTEGDTEHKPGMEKYVAKLEGELKTLKKELEDTYESISAKKFRAPYQLRALLQATYNIESQHYNEKKLHLESKATEVKLRNQKLQKKKASFLGYYKMAQENSLEEDINTIVEVKEAIMQVTREIKERAARWKAIEELCGCNLMVYKSDLNV